MSDRPPRKLRLICWLAVWVGFTISSSIVGALLRGFTAADGVWGGLALIGIYAAIVVWFLVSERFGTGEGKGQFPAPKDGINRWKQQ